MIKLADNRSLNMVNYYIDCILLYDVSVSYPNLILMIDKLHGCTLSRKSKVRSLEFY